MDIDSGEEFFSAEQENPATTFVDAGEQQAGEWWSPGDLGCRRMEASGDTCIFSDIVSGKAGANMVYENDVVAAFMDTSPVTTGHVLVIPREHRCEGVNMFLADGAVAFQEVFHSHLHMFPRFEGDPFRIDADWQRLPLNQLERPAQQLRDGLALIR